ncbi:hypothetical protein EV1_001884 [Malus domestica]
MDAAQKLIPPPPPLTFQPFVQSHPVFDAPVFRTEASYSRFEEGKKAWAEVITGANDFAKLVISSVENSGDAQ